MLLYLEDLILSAACAPAISQNFDLTSSRLGTAYKTVVPSSFLARSIANQPQTYLSTYSFLQREVTFYESPSCLVISSRRRRASWSHQYSLNLPLMLTKALLIEEDTTGFSPLHPCCVYLSVYILIHTSVIYSMKELPIAVCNWLFATLCAEKPHPSLEGW